MIHIRTDTNELNADRKFFCGIGPLLPDGDKWVYEREYGLRSMVDCPICQPVPYAIGRPASSMNGNAADRIDDPERWANWVAFCNANGHP